MSCAYSFNIWWICKLVIHENLHHMGFHAVEVGNAQGSTPLECSLVRHEIRIANWFLAHGADPVFCSPGTPFRWPNALFHLAHVFPTRHSYERPRGLGLEDALHLFGIRCSATLGDGCECFRSSAGCLPVHMLLRCANVGLGDNAWPSGNPPESDLRDLGFLCGLGGLSDEERELYHLEICRLDAFERLGMAHTCCGTCPADSHYFLQGIPYHAAREGLFSRMTASSLYS